MWTPGEIFYDRANAIAVCVKRATATGFDVIVATSPQLDCTALSDLTPSVLSTVNRRPLASDDFRLQLMVTNIGTPAYFARVVAAPPPGTHYVLGSATTGQGTVTETSDGADFALGTVPYGATVELTYSVHLEAGSPEPIVLTPEAQLTWNGGSLLVRSSVIANARELFVPLVWAP